MIIRNIRHMTISGIILIALLFHHSVIMGQQAPVTVAADVTAATIDAQVPVMVTGFQDIASVSLLMHYDPQVAVAVSVAAHADLAVGSFAWSVSVPGEVIISWYTTVSGVTLPAGAEAFTITFDRVSFGTTALEWVDDGTSCEYAAWDGGLVTVLGDQPASTYYLDGSLTFVQHAPITTLHTVEVCDGGEVEVPVTVKEFINIGAISLTFTFDPAVLAYTGFIPHASLPANFVVAEHSSGMIVVSGYVDPQDPGITLVDDETLFVALFDHLGGNTLLEWFDDGTSCEFAAAYPPGYPPLPDTPQQDFYLDGSVGALPRPTVAVSGTTTIDRGQSADVTFTLTGTPPWVLTWSDGVDNTVVTGIVSSPYVITVAPLFTTTYTAVALSDQQCESVAADITGEALVTVRFAPGTHLPAIDDACEGHLLEVPVTVTHFNDIGAISLTLLYDENVLDFQGFIPHPALPANFVAAASTPGIMVASGYIGIGDPGITLADHTTLFTMQFLYLGGSTTLDWYDDGISCEYASADLPHFSPLPDSPQNEYYFDGVVDGYPSPTAHVSGSIDICAGEEATVTFDLTGTPPWTLSWSENGSNTTTVSGITTSPYEITRTFTEPTLFEVVALGDFYCAAIPDGMTGSALINASHLNCVLFVRTFLQGAYSTVTQQMRTDLNQLSYLPLNQPYGNTPLAYQGTESVTAFLPEVVDWIVVELRTGSAAATMVARQAALVLSNGDVVSAEDQQQPPSFGAIVPGEQYYVVIYHRNHLPVMTATPVVLPNTSATKHDFTADPVTNVYGGLMGVFPVETGVYGQITGDINMDNKLIYSGSNNDRGLIYARIGTLVQPLQLTSFIFGYYSEDLNMNGEVRYSGTGNDQGIIISNIDQLTDPTFLNTVFTGPVPVDY
jgi:PKD repeat protein